MTSLVPPDLDNLKYQLKQLFEDPHLDGVMLHVYALVYELKGISTQFRLLTKEKDDYKEKFKKLSLEYKKLKTTVKNEPLCELFENINSVENVNSHAENHPIVKTEKEIDSSPSENNIDHVSEIQETLLNLPDSPILRKSKTKSKSNSSDTTVESPNKSQLLDKENSHVNNKSHISLSEKILTIDKCNEKFSKQCVTPTITKLKKHSQKLLNSPSNKKSIVNMKQSKIQFKNSKPKNILDISKSNSFLGGNRNLTGESSKKQPENSLDFSKELENNSENTDCIEESPSCMSHKQTKIRKHKLPKLLISKLEEKIFDNDETILIPPKIKKETENSTISSIIDEESDQNLKLNNPESLSFGFHVNDVSEEILSNRKKADKTKLPGWSCKKCSDFYSVAFKGNEEMIRKKMNECSKHRGKFNPERRNTPPGFWEVNMPQTPTDSENN